MKNVPFFIRVGIPFLKKAKTGTFNKIFEAAEGVIKTKYFLATQ
jgi:hypothetical protein